MIQKRRFLKTDSGFNRVLKQYSEQYNNKFISGSIYCPQQLFHCYTVHQVEIGNKYNRVNLSKTKSKLKCNITSDVIKKLGYNDI